MVYVYQEPILRRYAAGRCSFGSLFWLAAAVVVVLVPFFAAYASHSFWLENSSYYEQPDVAYEYKVLMLAEGVRSDVDHKSTGQSFQLFFSTNTSFNNLYQDSVRIPVIRSNVHDANDDLKADRIDISVQMPLQDGEQIHQLTMMVFFDVRLRKRALLSMESVGYMQYASPMPGRAVHLATELQLHQRAPLHVTGGVQYPYNALLPSPQPWEVLDAKELLFPNLLRSYIERNLTMRFEKEYITWERAPTAAQGQGPNNRNFTAYLSVQVPQAEVWYVPQWSEMLKFAWIQYYALYVIVAYLVQAICSFVYSNQIVPTYVVADSSFGKGKKSHAF
jgi:transmembrane protein 231